MALSAAGCSTVAAQTLAPHDPFTARMNGGEGIVVELKGYAHGHQAGGEAHFELALRNDGDDAWQGRYCLVLVDQNGPVATFAADSFSLQPGAGDARTIDTRLPESLADGCYGLALVLPDRLASVTTVTVGEGDGPCGEPWPAPECP